MQINDLKNKKITVMGLGLHGGGIGTIRFLSWAGANIIVTDIKSKEELAPSLEKLKDLKNITYIFNQHRSEDFTKVDMVIKNPAVPWDNKYVKMSLENKIVVEMDSSLFFKLCKNPIVGITGTKGKTTVSTLIYEILKAAGKSPVKVGVGQVSSLDKLKDLKKENIVVFELSSWRLSALGRYKLSPHVAVITNIFPDHLNYYKSMGEYIKDKKYIFQNKKPGDFCVVNWDDEVLNKLDGEIKSNLIKFSKNKIDQGRSVYLNEGTIYVNDGVDEKRVIDATEIKLKGEHNISNVLAAISAGVALDVDLKIIKKAVAEFKGVAHRLELVREIEGVKYYNDTAATTPEAAISGINSFSEPIVLICGGSDKNLDMGEFGKIISEKIKSVIFLKGKATEKIVAAIKKNLSPEESNDFKIVESMEKAVELARAEAKSGDVILLSPGAASFGMFQNEFDRGDKFKAAVNALK
jgi:UDP-N-acetylmuramoylalanine--D-glutamate ligase